MTSFPVPPDPPPLTEADRRWLGRAAAAALCRSLGVVPPVVPTATQTAGVLDSTESPPAGAANARAGVFVTLFHEDRLRGCLGTAATPDPLSETVPRFTLAAATRDSRFRTIEVSELPGLRIEITTLGELAPLPADPAVVLEGLDPLVHGVYLKLGDRTSLLLPQVARRLDWGPLELLRQLSIKARLSPDAWQERGAQLSAFCAASFEAVATGELARGSPPGGPSASESSASHP